MKIITYYENQWYIKYPLHILLLFIILIQFQSCDKDDKDPVNVYNYFPLAIGHYMVYDVNEEVYSSGQANPVITTYQEKDEISRITTDANGISTFIISRSSRKTAADYWQKIKEYSVEQLPDKLIFNNGNQLTVPFIFPIDQQVTWNGNMYNNLDEEDYHYEDINQPYQNGNQTFEKALTLVERRDTTSVIDYALGIKRFALGVGLIYDEQTSYQYCQATTDCIGKGIIDSGTKRTRKIVEYSPLQ